MFSAFYNSIKIPEVRTKLLFTLGLLFIARIGANIPLPGLDVAPLQEFLREQAVKSGGEGGMLTMLNVFSGGGFANGAVCALGIAPYISASIIFQLMTAVIPSFARLAKEGETGRQKLNQYTRYATILICLVQGGMYVGTLLHPEQLFQNFHGQIVVAENQVLFFLTSVSLITAGTLLLMWLGEQITQRGLGNGVSLLITVNILSDLPSAISTLKILFSKQVGTEGLGMVAAVLMVTLFFVVLAGVVAITQATRKIPVTFAKRIVGRKVYGGQSSVFPLKVNYSGVMPIIFSSTILMFGSQILDFIGKNLWPSLQTVSGVLQGRGATYFVIDGLMIFVFSYFWVSVMFKPVQIADDLKKQGGYIPGVRPGEPTAKFLDFVMTRLTFAGAIFLTILAIVPGILLNIYQVPYQVGQFFGGTGILIIVGVMLDFLRQVENFLIQRHYDGFLKKGRLKARSPGAPVETRFDASEFRHLAKLWLILGLLLSLGLVAWLFNAGIVGSIGSN